MAQSCLSPKPCVHGWSGCRGCTPTRPLKIYKAARSTPQNERIARALRKRLPPFNASLLPSTSSYRMLKLVIDCSTILHEYFRRLLNTLDTDLSKSATWPLRGESYFIVLLAVYPGFRDAVQTYFRASSSRCRQTCELKLATNGDTWGGRSIAYVYCRRPNYSRRTDALSLVLIGTGGDYGIALVWPTLDLRFPL